MSWISLIGNTIVGLLSRVLAFFLSYVWGRQSSQQEYTTKALGIQKKYAEIQANAGDDDSLSEQLRDGTF